MYSDPIARIMTPLCPRLNPLHVPHQAICVLLREKD